MKSIYRLLLLCIAVMLSGISLNAQEARGIGRAAESSTLLSPGDYDKAQPPSGQQASTSRQATLADEEPVTLYGVLVQRNSWNQSGQGQYGMYKFDAVSDQSQLKFTPMFYDERMISTSPGVYVDGKYYLFYSEVLYGYLFNGLWLIVYDGDTGEILRETKVEGAQRSDTPYSLTYDPVTKSVYGYCQKSSEYGMENRLCRVDLETGKILEDVGTLLNDVFFVMQFSQTGVLYGISNRGNLYTIDAKTAACTLVGNTGWQPLFNQSGAIDQRSNRMFWAYYTSNTGALLEVDLTTAQTTKIVDFPDGENFLGLHTRTALADDAAPAIPTDLSVTFKAAGSMSATFSATAPTLTFDGGTLTSDVSLVFMVDDVEVGEVASVAPGQKGNFEYTFTAEGAHRVTVMAKHGDSESPKLTIETYAGYDTPKGVTDLTLELDAETGEYQLSWTAPDEVGVNNGLVDVEDFTYRIIQYPSSLVIEEDYASTSYSGTIKNLDLQNYSFGVVVKSQGKESQEVRSNRVQYGGAISVPFTEDFETDLNWELYTVTDANHDGYTWVWSDGRAAYQGTSCPNAASDWLFTPPIQMREGITYSLYVTFDGGYWQTENFKIVANPGWDLTNPGMEILYDKTQEFYYGQVQVDYTAPRDGRFYFGFHCYSPQGTRGIQIDSYSIVASEAPDAPANVDNLTAVAADLGVLNSTLSFDAPTTTVEGTQLADDDITSISIYRQGEFVPIHTFDDVKPGQHCEWTDMEAVHGINTYNVVSYGETGNSAGVGTEVWVGEDFATAPQEFEAIINRDNNSVEFSWEKPTGSIHNGYVDWDNVTYTLQFMVPELTESLMDIATGITETSYVDNSVMAVFLEMPDQYDIIFVVSAVTSAGVGQPATADGSTGDAYGLPYWESFSNGYLTTAPWTYSSSDETTADSWLLVEDASSPHGVMSYDNDGGAAMFYQQDCDAEARLIGPRINLNGTSAPIMRFYMYHDVSVPEEGNLLQLEIRYENGDKDEFIAFGDPIPVNNGKYGWIMHEVPMYDLVGEGEFRISFFGKAQQGVDFYVDNISIKEKADWGYPSVNDLRATVVDGEGINLTWSAPSVSDAYTVLGYEVYVDEELYNSELLTATECLVPLMDGSMHTFYVVVVYEDGESGMSNVVETTAPSGIYDSSVDDVRIIAGDGNIVIEVGQESSMTVCSVDGKLVYNEVSSSDVVVPVERGVYVVKVNDVVKKVIVD